jgi:hypothetical protein
VSWGLVNAGRRDKRRKRQKKAKHRAKDPVWSLFRTTSKHRTWPSGGVRWAFRRQWKGKEYFVEIIQMAGEDRYRVELRDPRQYIHWDVHGKTVIATTYLPLTWKKRRVSAEAKKWADYNLPRTDLELLAREAAENPRTKQPTRRVHLKWKPSHPDYHPGKRAWTVHYGPHFYYLDATPARKTYRVSLSRKTHPKSGLPHLFENIGVKRFPKMKGKKGFARAVKEWAEHQMLSPLELLARENPGEGRRRGKTRRRTYSATNPASALIATWVSSTSPRAG